MKQVLILFGLLFLVVVGGFISQRFFEGKGLPFLVNLPTATINNQTLKLLVAKTAEDKQIGLSKKTSLPQDTGMVFPFEKPDYYFFWMKNMQMPIDMIFLRDGKVVTIYQNLQPNKDATQLYAPEEPADMVVEVNAGFVQKYNIKKGDTLKVKDKLT